MIVTLLAFASIVQLAFIFPSLAPFRPYFIICAIACAVMALKIMRGEDTGISRVRFLSWAVVLLVFSEAFPAMLKLNFHETLSILSIWIKIAFIFFALFTLMESEKQVVRVLAATLCAVCIIMLQATLTYFANVHLFLKYGESIPRDMLHAIRRLGPQAFQLIGYGRLGAYGMYQNPNDYGLLLTLSIPIILKFSELTDRILLKALLGALFFIAVWEIFLTGSRGSFLGASIVTLLCVLSRASVPKKVRIAFAAALIIGIFGFGVKKIVAARGGTVTVFAGRGHTEDRLGAWEACGRMLIHNPWGMGFTKSHDYMKEYGNPVNMPPHNTYVKVAAEAGFLGFFAYVGMLYFVVSRLMRLEYYYRKIKPDRRVIIIQALLFSLIGFLWNTSFSQKEYELFLYILLACSARMILLSPMDEEYQWR